MLEGASQNVIKPIHHHSNEHHRLRAPLGRAGTAPNRKSKTRNSRRAAVSVSRRILYSRTKPHRHPLAYARSPDAHNADRSKLIGAAASPFGPQPSARSSCPSFTCWRAHDPARVTQSDSSRGPSGLRWRRCSYLDSNAFLAIDCCRDRREP